MIQKNCWNKFYHLLEKSETTFDNKKVYDTSNPYVLKKLQ